MSNFNFKIVPLLLTLLFISSCTKNTETVSEIHFWTTNDTNDNITLYINGVRKGILKNPMNDITCPIDDSYQSDLITFRMFDDILYHIEAKNEAGEVKVSASYIRGYDEKGLPESTSTGLIGGLKLHTEEDCTTAILSY